MNANLSMKSLLEKHLIDSMDSIPHDDAYPIWHKTDHAGRIYWGVASFYELDKHPISPNQDLSQLEWEGNEVHLCAYSEEDVTNMLKKAIGILLFWKNDLEASYADYSFYLLVSYDDGNMLIFSEDEVPVKSISMRFWADRGENTVINLSNFDNWDQPAIVEYIASTAPKT